MSSGRTWPKKSPLTQERSAAILGDEVVRLEAGSQEQEAADRGFALSEVNGEMTGEAAGDPGVSESSVEPGEDEGIAEHVGEVRRIFTNLVLQGGEEGEYGLCRQALSIEQVASRILEATGGWPRRIGRQLFAMSHEGLRFLDDPTALFAWLQSSGSIRWASGSDDREIDFVTRAELTAHLRMAAPCCSMVSSYPWEPLVPGTHSTWRVPKTYQPAGAFLDRLLARFCPATPMDASLLRAMFLTFVWGGLPGQRPLFILTGDRADTRGIGRTQCLRLLAEAVGGTQEVSAAEPGMVRGLEARLASPFCIQTRVVLIDEFPGVLLPQALARWVDAEVFESQSEDAEPFRRPNLITWCVAARGDTDMSGGCLADRAVVIRLAAPDRDGRPHWQSEARAFVQDQRDRILADAVAVLRGERHPISARPHPLSGLV